jgi:hypothetical protein
VTLLGSPRPFPLLALLLLPLGGCTRAYLQNDGTYDFVVDESAAEGVEVLRDDCGLVDPSKHLWDARLEISGNVVRMELGWRHLQLIGAFRNDDAGEVDTFVLDGTESNAAISLAGGECLADQIAVHLEGTTQRATAFSGVLSVRIDPRVQQPECSCQLWVKYRAVQKSVPSASFPSSFP